MKILPPPHRYNQQKAFYLNRRDQLFARGIFSCAKRHLQACVEKSALDQSRESRFFGIPPSGSTSKRP